MGCRDFSIELHQIEVLLCVSRQQQQASQCVTEPPMIPVHVNGHSGPPMSRVKIIQIDCANRVPFPAREERVQHPAKLSVPVQVVLPGSELLHRFHADGLNTCPHPPIFTRVFHAWSWDIAQFHGAQTMAA